MIGCAASAIQSEVDGVEHGEGGLAVTGDYGGLTLRCTGLRVHYFCLMSQRQFVPCLIRRLRHEAVRSLLQRLRLLSARS